MSRALVTDLYQLTMAASYLRRGMSAPATFSLFVRNLPANRGFLVAAGLEDSLSFLESFAFAPEDLTWLGHAGFPDVVVQELASLRFTGDVYAVPEGRVVFANEPLIEVTAPIAQAQLVESYLLNQVTFQTAIATKATRCKMAAGEMELVDFSLRRTHGADAAMAAARVSAIAGFAGTSNVEAARRFGLNAVGTMAHSYVEAFASEADAFRAFASDYPGQASFLVDTYDTLQGVQIAIDVIRGLSQPTGLAIRLDSGNLARLAQEVRSLLDAAGLPEVRIIASGGLDEYALERFQSQGVPIDAAGIGTRMGVSADAPYLDSSYKMVSFDGRPVLKLSTGKATLPGAKQVWRRQALLGDVLARRDEPGSADAEPLLDLVMRAGRRVRPAPSIADARQQLLLDLAWLPPAARQLRDPRPPDVTLSIALKDLADEASANLQS